MGRDISRPYIFRPITNIDGRDAIYRVQYFAPQFRAPPISHRKNTGVSAISRHACADLIGNGLI